ncbi:MAG: helix-turn-helix transcriptional regulator, partial [Myxococcota bacterium]|nr:helix-turn-helix transcriptional regulator [Myxococcota bacterium]
MANQPIGQYKNILDKKITLRYHLNMIDDISSNLALNVRQLRSARQLSQVQLAQIAGIPRPTLAHLESGSANPT